MDVTIRRAVEKDSGEFFFEVSIGTVIVGYVSRVLIKENGGRITEYSDQIESWTEQSSGPIKVVSLDGPRAEHEDVTGLEQP